MRGYLPGPPTFTALAAFALPIIFVFWAGFTLPGRLFTLVANLMTPRNARKKFGRKNASQRARSAQSFGRKKFRPAKRSAS